MIDETMAEYNPPRRFRGALANTPESLWEASLDPATGVFTIRDNVPEDSEDHASEQPGR
jgi:hypothetical protein